MTSIGDMGFSDRIEVAGFKRFVSNIYSGLQLLWGDNLAKAAIIYLSVLTVVTIIGPEVVPYDYDAFLVDSQGQLLRAESPSLAHPLGTTATGQDVLSRLLYGTRPTVLTGILGGTIIITLGMSFGIAAGYLGGRVEFVLMRITDFVYAMPLIPFAVVLLGLVDLGFYASILIIGAILWRSSARVIRSQVLQVKERDYVMAAKADGAGTVRIIRKHIVPNVASMAVLYFALGIGYSILAQASLAFLGLVNPFVPSWGVMLRSAYQSGYMATAVWWSIPPGLLISGTVLSAFLLGRRYESITGSDPNEAMIDQT